MPTESESDDLFEFYRYKPSIAAAIFFIVAFSTLSTVHILQSWRSRNWICICFVVGGLSEVQSYIARILSAKQSPDYTLGLYVAQGTGALIAPAIFAAAIYVSLGRIIAFVEGEKHSLIRSSWLTSFFVVGDITGLAIQGVGAVFMPMGTYKDYMTGSNIVIGGLSLLVFSITLFIITALTFHIRILRNPTHISSSSTQWQHHLTVLYTTSSMIFVRSIYRLVEYGGGNNSALMRSEWTLYVLDAMLMWAVLCVFAIWPVLGKGAKADEVVVGSRDASGFRLRSWRARKHGESVGSEEVAMKGAGVVSS